MSAGILLSNLFPNAAKKNKKQHGISSTQWGETINRNAASVPAIISDVYQPACFPDRWGLVIVTLPPTTALGERNVWSKCMGRLKGSRNHKGPHVTSYAARRSIPALPSPVCPCNRSEMPAPLTEPASQIPEGSPIVETNRLKPAV